MAQIRSGESPKTQIDCHEYWQYLSQSPGYNSGTNLTPDTPFANKEIDTEWPYQETIPVQAGAILLNLNDLSQPTLTANNKLPVTLALWVQGLLYFGWNLGGLTDWDISNHAQEPLCAGCAQAMTLTPVIWFGGTVAGPHDLITTLSDDEQRVIDKNLYETVRNFPQNIKDALIEDEECRSGKGSVQSRELRSLLYAEVQELPCAKGTTTKLIGPAGSKLIRITGGKPTEIEGTLDASNDVIYLINPHGVTVHPKSEIK